MPMICLAGSFVACRKMFSLNLEQASVTHSPALDGNELDSFICQHFRVGGYGFFHLDTCRHASHHFHLLIELLKLLQRDK